MKLQKISVDVSYWITKTIFFIAVLIVVYMLVMSLTALFGVMPEKFFATIELPLILENTAANYPVTELNEELMSKGIEIKHVELEVLPHDNRTAQFLSYLHAAFYVSLISFILYRLLNFVSSVRSNDPFNGNNVKYIFQIGVTLLTLAVYDWLVRLITKISYAKYFVVNDARFAKVTVIDINLELVFCAMIIMVLAQAFKRGNELQELENLTV